jgi:ubiquinone biosynthesis protein
MVGRLSAERRDELLSLMLGLVQRDAAAVAEVLLDWAGDDSLLDDTALRADIETFVDQYHGVPLADLSLADMLADVTAILRQHRLALPPDLALLIKVFITLEGLGRSLDPGFHMAAEAVPLLRQALRDRYQPRVLAQRGWQALRQVAGLLGGLPRDLARLLRTARKGRIQVQIDITELRSVGDQLERAAQRIAVSLIIAALIVGSSIVMTVGGGPTLLGLPAFGLLGFIGATLGALWLLFGGRK